MSIQRIQVRGPAYSIHSQLPSIYGGRLLQPQPEDATCRGDSYPLNMKCLGKMFTDSWQGQA